MVTATDAIAVGILAGLVIFAVTAYIALAQFDCHSLIDDF